MWPADPKQTALQAIGVVTGSVTVLYFVFNNNLGLSPFTTALVGLLLAAGFLVVSLRHEETADTVSLYVLAGVSFLAGSLRFVSAYDLQDLGTLLALSFVSLVSYGLARFRDGLPTPPRTAARVLVVAVVVLSVVFVGVDLGTGDVGHSVETVEEVTIPAEDPDHHEPTLRLGTLTYTNPSPIPKEAGYPRLEGCVRGVNTTDRGSGVYTRVDRDSNSLIAPLSTTQGSIVTHLDRERFNVSRFDVVRTDRCPANTSTPTIAVYLRPESAR